MVERVTNGAVWNQIRILFLGSALLFLINIYFGFSNALTFAGPDLSPGIIPRWQVLIHLHAGTIGWITLSVIGFALWVFTGQREVSPSYVRGVKALSWVALLVFFGYIASFGLAFSIGGGAFALLPIFGISAMLVIWAAAFFVFSQLRYQPVVTTIHILVAGALLVVSVGALMGVLLGLERVIGQFIPNLPPDDRVGIHAGNMDVYLFLAASALVEGFVRRDSTQRWTRAGMTQAIAWTVAALLIPIATLTALPMEFILLFVILLFLGLGVFLARMARVALGRLPLDASPRSWAFFGTLWLIIFTIVFVYAAFVVLPDIASAPRWFGAVFVHSAMVGMMTNLLLGLYTARTEDTQHLLRWGGGLAIGLINLGLLIFFLLEIFADSRLGALVMGVGVLLGVLTMILRLLASGSAARSGGGAAA